MADDICVHTRSVNWPESYDSVEIATDKTGLYWHYTGTFSGEGLQNYTSRPTNTSVLYCIKYQPTYWINFDGDDMALTEEEKVDIIDFILAPKAT